MRWPARADGAGRRCRPVVAVAVVAVAAARWSVSAARERGREVGRTGGEASRQLGALGADHGQRGADHTPGSAVALRSRGPVDHGVAQAGEQRVQAVERDQRECAQLPGQGGVGTVVVPGVATGVTAGVVRPLS